MSSSRNFVCIVCPNGCNIETHIDQGMITEIKGNKCKRGEEYARQELTNPRRTISTTVRIEGGELPLCSVRLTKAIPKNEIFKVMEKINQIELKAPVYTGQIVIHQVCGTDSDVIVTKDMKRFYK